MYTVGQKTNPIFFTVMVVVTLNMQEKLRFYGYSAKEMKMVVSILGAFLVNVNCSRSLYAVGCLSVVCSLSV